MNSSKKKKVPIQHLVPNNPQADKQLTGGTNWDAKAEADAKRNTLYDSSYRTVAGHWKQRDEPDEAEQYRQSDRIQQMLQARRQQASRDRLKSKGAVPIKQGKKLFDAFVIEARSHHPPNTTPTLTKRDIKTLRNLYNAATSLEFDKWLILVADENI